MSFFCGAAQGILTLLIRVRAFADSLKSPLLIGLFADSGVSAIVRGLIEWFSCLKQVHCCSNESPLNRCFRPVL